MERTRHPELDGWVQWARYKRGVLFTRLLTGEYYQAHPVKIPRGKVYEGWGALMLDGL
jgi:hypothetical protein